MGALNNKAARIFVSGHNGMVGSAFLRFLKKAGYENLITRSRGELDLRDSRAVGEFFNAEKPEVVLLIAAKVGGIAANMRVPAEFLYDNVMIQSNIIHNSAMHKCAKLVFFGSSCIYPRDCHQPMREEYLMTAPLEPTNEGYAVAKLAGLKMSQFYHQQYGLPVLNLMPCNLYGENDSFDPENSHVLSALVKKFCDAVKNGTTLLTLWGSGAAKREFMHIDDLVDAVLHLDSAWERPEMINVGPGIDLSIRELSEIIATLTGFTGEIIWDKSRPDGMPRKCMDISKLEGTGFKVKVQLETGIAKVIEQYRKSFGFLGRKGK